MALTNSQTLYGTVCKTFHWLTVLLIFTVIPLGIVAHNMALGIQAPGATPTEAEIARTAFLFSMHKTIGITIFFVALARIAWVLSQPKPATLAGQKGIEHFGAATVHWLLYGSLILVPLTGWIHHAATEGFAPIWWPLGQNLPLVPESESVAHTFASLHIIFERVLVAALLLHIAGALKHHFIDKDATLRRMWFGRIDAPAVTDKKSGPALPILAALGAWVLALVIGAGMGLFAKGEAVAATAPELAQVETGWEVQDGTLAITIMQLGGAVGGSFADFTAAIEFSETATDGKHGTTEVTISIPSLTLGTVTAQAMGPDFFDAEGFPTATFTADLLPAETGYIAEGTLTLKGAEVPVSLPFTLAIEGDTATMSGTTSLDRRDFGIGQGYADESSVGFTVEVQIDLTATRTAE